MWCPRLSNSALTSPIVFTFLKNPSLSNSMMYALGPPAFGARLDPTPRLRSWLNSRLVGERGEGSASSERRSSKTFSNATRLSSVSLIPDTASSAFATNWGYCFMLQAIGPFLRNASPLTVAVSYRTTGTAPHRGSCVTYSSRPVTRRPIFRDPLKSIFGTPNPCARRTHPTCP
jgi:hypothetical protein